MNPTVFFKALADETRLRALLLITQEGELCVCELMSALQESQLTTRSSSRAMGFLPAQSRSSPMGASNIGRNLGGIRQFYR